MKYLLLLGTKVLLLSLAACSNNHSPLSSLSTSAKHATTSESAKKTTHSEHVSNNQSNKIKEDTHVISSPTFDAPSGWSRTDVDGVIIFKAPEDDATLALVNLPVAKDELEAAQLAFTKIQSDFSRSVKFNTKVQAKNGWEAIHGIEYQTSPAEERVIYAYPHKYQEQWSVLLLDGHLGTIAKRGAAARSTLNSLIRSGFISENLSDRIATILNANKVKEFVNFVATSADDLSIPGIGIGIIQNGQIVYSGGTGVKNIQDRTPVDGDTKFLIASNTKGMTTLLLAKLVEMGRISWTDTVIQHYPDFRLGDDATTKSVQIKHLVCACTGLPRKDFEWLFNNEPSTPASSVFTELAATQPTSGFGEIYQYNNQMAAAGYVAAHIFYPNMEIGAAYDRAMQEYIFDPLGMHNTTFDFSSAIQGNFASPYGVNLNGELVSIRQTESFGLNHTITALRPAGAAWSTTTDMLKYIQNELDKGVAKNGKRLFAEAPLLARREPSVQTGTNASYGMGLISRNISGIKIVEHGGSMAGYKSQIVIIPEANVGAVILTNSERGASLIGPFTRKLVELLYDGKPTAEVTVASSVASIETLLAKQRTELTIPADPTVVADLASKYGNSSLGDMVLSNENDRLTLNTGTWSGPLATKVNDDGTTSIVVTEGSAQGFEFIIGKNAEKRTLKLLDAQHSYTFTEVN